MPKLATRSAITANPPASSNWKRRMAMLPSSTSDMVRMGGAGTSGSAAWMAARRAPAMELGVPEARATNTVRYGIQSQYPRYIIATGNWCASARTSPATPITSNHWSFHGQDNEDVLRLVYLNSQF